MALRLEERTVRLEVPLGEGSAETVVEGTVTVPGERPRVDRALRLVGTPRIESCRAEEGRVSVEGVIDLRLLYATEGLTPGGRAARAEPESAELFEDDALAADVEEEPVESLHAVAWPAALPFSFSIDVPDCSEGMRAEPEVRVDTVHFEVRADERTLDVELGLACTARVTEVHAVRIAHRVVGAPHVEYESRPLRLRAVIAHCEGSAAIEQVLPLAGRPPIGRVLSLELIPVVVEGEAREGSVVVRGAMDVRSLYVASDPSLGVRYEVWPKAIPFEVQCETPDARAGVRIQPQLSLENVNHRVVGGNGEEGLRVTAALSAAAKLTEVCELACITELFAEEGEEIAVRKEQMQLFELLGERSEQVEAVGTLDVGEGEGGIDRLVCGEARVVPEDIHVLGDRVAVEGALSLTILYSGRSEGQRGLRVGEWPAAIAFQCEIPIDGAEPGMERWVRFGPPRVELDLINRQTIEARATFAVTAGVGREVELEAVVEAVSVPPAVADPPTFTFLVLQDGDTLWKVARQYRTEVEAIVAANPWLSDVEGERLPVGRKLCIPRAKAAGS